MDEDAGTRKEAQPGSHSISSLAGGKIIRPRDAIVPEDWPNAIPAVRMLPIASNSQKIRLSQRLRIQCLFALPALCIDLSSTIRKQRSQEIHWRILLTHPPPGAKWILKVSWRLMSF